ncbi:mechanosensitive ion channel family protein [Siminovitchia sediminis]|uniref:Mechanosensitive ion channel family protein n=1 Tax=Siminovitchia sediminis TaxID=1274353 RepID=A0ABW4KGW2_9BACI
MADHQIQHRLDFLKNVSVMDIILFFIYALLIFGTKSLILFIIRKIYRSENSKNNFIPTAESILNWLAFYGTIILFIFYFSKEKWLFAPIYSVKGINVSLFLILVAFMIITLANRLVQAFNSYIMPLAYNRFNIDIGTRYTINRLLYYTVMIIAVISSLAIVGFNWRAIAVVLSTLGIGIGFGLRNVAANFVSGLIILFEQPLEVGEVIEVDGQKGVVTKIKLRSTSVKLYKEGTLVIPNQYLIENMVKNFADEKLCTDISVAVAYGTDTKKAEALLHEAAVLATEGEEGVLQTPPPVVTFKDIKEGSLIFSVEIPLQNARMKETIESKVRHLIISSFYKNKIQVADYIMEENLSSSKGD